MTIDRNVKLNSNLAVKFHIKNRGQVSGMCATHLNMCYAKAVIVLPSRRRTHEGG